MYTFFNIDISLIVALILYYNIYYVHMYGIVPDVRRNIRLN